MTLALFAIAIAAAAPQGGAPAAVPAVPAVPAVALQDSDLAARPLAAGQTARAVALLERASAAAPSDPALLINLGIAYAQAGDEAKARAAFEKALACEEVAGLDTADGTVTDSRRLARRAIRMLDRGEFRAAGRGGQLTLKD